MTALAPLFLNFLPLAALPVLFHLFFRVRRRRKKFPSLLFFLAADPRVHYRRKLREWLLLVLRTLALLLLILGLARPVFQGSGGTPRKLAVVADNSASMRASDAEGRSRLSRALAIAAALAESGGAELTLAATTVADLRAALPDSYGVESAPMRAVLETVVETSAAGLPFEAVRRAVAAGAALPGLTEIHVVTDGDGPEWGGGAAEALPDDVRVFIHVVGRAGDRAEPLALRRVAPPAAAVPADRIWFAEAELENHGREPAEATVVFGVGDAEWRGTVTVAGGGVQNVRAVMPGLPAGRYAVSVNVVGAVAKGFDEGWFEVAVSPPLTVVLVGEVNSAGVLAAALDPVGDGRLSGYQVRSAATGAEAAGLIRGAAGRLALVGADFAAAHANGELLRQAVEAGATVLLYPRPEATEVGALPPWCGVTASGTAARLGEGTLLDVAWDDPLWWPVRELAAGGRTPPPISVTRALALAPAEGTRVAAAAGGIAVLTVRAAGRGRVVVSGVAWDPLWSEWPKRAAFVPMLLALPSAAGDRPSALFTAGERLTLPLAQEEAVDLLGAKGPSLWQGSGAACVTVPAVPGLYTAVQGTNRWVFGVAGDTRDRAGTRAGALTPPEWAPQAVVLEPVDAADAVRLVERARRGIDLTGWLLAAALLCQAAELAVAHHRVFRHG